MTNYGTGYEKARAAFKAECAARNEPCWICHNTRGPIDYVSKYNPKLKQPLLFSLDHADPVSLGHDPMRTDRWRASHLSCNVSRGNTTRGLFPSTRKW